MKSKRIFNLDDFETNKVKDLIAELRGYTKIDPGAWREEYRKKQAAGVKFERLCCDGEWEGAEANGGPFNFTLEKEDYREVPQEVFASECQKAALEHLAKTYSADKGTAQLNPTIPPHAAERALWKAQREAGTNEVWQWAYVDDPKKIWTDIRVDDTPTWQRSFIYRVKPMKLTAVVVRKWSNLDRVQDWQLYGTREEYRAECEKYGYVVVSNIEEVKPKTVKYYFALFKNAAGKISVEFADESNVDTLKGLSANWSGHTIIGNIETREVEV